MDELIIIVDHFGHKELKEYLEGLEGIFDIDIKSNEYLEIYVKYNPALITVKIIKMEILLFLDTLKIPTTIAFDKCSKKELSEYKIIKNNICCEWCLKGSIEDLFEIDGIEKAECNFNEELLDNKSDNIVITIKYNSDLLSIEDIKNIESTLSL